MADYGLLLGPTPTPSTPLPQQPMQTPTTAPTPTTINQNAQDVAKAQGVAYEDIAKTAQETPTETAPAYDATKVSSQIADAAAIKTGTSYYDEAKGTVAGRLTSLLNNESPYMKQAEQRSKEASSRKGLLNTSIAVQAGQAAAYDAALPIAQQDASEFNKFGLQQQTAENQQRTIQSEAIVSGEMTQQKAAIAQQAQNIQNAFNAKLSGANEQSKAWLEGMSENHNKTMQELEHNQNLVLQQFQNDLEKQKTASTLASQTMQNYQISVENLMTDPDFMDLGPTAMNNAINQMQILAKNSIKFIGAASNIPNFSQWANTYLTALSVAS